MDKPLQAMKPWHYQMLEYMVEHPKVKVKELSQVFGKEEKHIVKCKNSPLFREKLEERLREVWQDSVAIAQDTMITLASNGDRQAAQYILDSCGYKPKEQVEFSADGFTININED